MASLLGSGVKVAPDVCLRGDCLTGSCVGVVLDSAGEDLKKPCNVPCFLPCDPWLDSPLFSRGVLASADGVTIPSEGLVVVLAGGRASKANI